jgi:hypothetical protein
MSALKSVLLAELTVMPLGSTSEFTMGNVTRASRKMFIVHRGGSQIMQGTPEQIIKLHSMLLDRFNIPALGITR